MKLSFSSQIAIDIVSILFIIGGIILLWHDGPLPIMVLVIGFILCIPWLWNLYKMLFSVEFNIESDLKRILPKIGCEIESIENSEDGDFVRIVGKYRDETLIFDTAQESPYLTIWDPSWFRVKANDPNIPKFMEAINQTNISTGPIVVFSSPDEDEIRYIHTICRTILPERYQTYFLDSTLVQMLNKKVDLKNNFKDYPWLNSSSKLKKPIGFNIEKQN